MDKLTNALIEQNKERELKNKGEQETSQLPPSNAIISKEIQPELAVKSTKEQLQEADDKLKLINTNLKIAESEKLRDLPEVLKTREAELNKKEIGLNEFAKRLEDREQALVLVEEDVKNRREDADRYYALRVKQAKEFTPQVQNKPKIKEIDYTRYR